MNRMPICRPGTSAAATIAAERLFDPDHSNPNDPDHGLRTACATAAQEPPP
jgi:hypothetical protein